MSRKKLLNDLNDVRQKIASKNFLAKMLNIELSKASVELKSLSIMECEIYNELSSMPKVNERPLRFYMIDILKEDYPDLHEEMKNHAIKLKNSVA